MVDPFWCKKIDSKIKQGTSWWETVFWVGFLLGLVIFVLSCFLICDTVVVGSIGVVRCGVWCHRRVDPGGGHGNKFKLLDITKEWSMNWKTISKWFYTLLNCFIFEVDSWDTAESCWRNRPWKRRSIYAWGFASWYELGDGDRICFGIWTYRNRYPDWIRNKSSWGGSLK